MTELWYFYIISQQILYLTAKVFLYNFTTDPIFDRAKVFLYNFITDPIFDRAKVFLYNFHSIKSDVHTGCFILFFIYIF